MTREFAARIIKECKKKGFKYTFYTLNEYHTALDMAINALEQEPCEDAISRQAVLDLINADWKYENLEQPVSTLPSVTLQQKGHWEHGKEISREYRGQTLVNINYLDWYCSNCHCVVEQSIKPEWSYCPNCGAKMVEPQESEGSNADSN